MLTLSIAERWVFPEQQFAPLPCREETERLTKAFASRYVEKQFDILIAA
jgi:hypothetical protein